MSELRFQPAAIEQIPIAALRPYARNPRTHSADQVAKLAASLAEFGWTQPVLVNDELEVVAGHGRLLAARQLGLAEVPTIRLSHLTSEQVRAYRIAATSWQSTPAGTSSCSPRVHEMNGLTGFSAEELDELLALIGDGDGLANEDVISEPFPNHQRTWFPDQDLWLLGDAATRPRRTTWRACSPAPSPT